MALWYVVTGVLLLFCFALFCSYRPILPTLFRFLVSIRMQKQRLTAPGTPDRGAYYHELFLRGRRDLCRLMQRTRVKGNGMKAAASPSTEPKFYEMEHCREEKAQEVVQDQQPEAEIQTDQEEERNVIKQMVSTDMDEDSDGDEGNEDASAEDCADVSTSVVTPESSPVGRFRPTINQNDFVLPFLDRPSSNFEDPLIPPSILSVKLNPKGIMPSAKPLSLASLLSPPPRTSSALLLSELHPEEDWGATRNDDDLSACLNLVLNQDDVEDDDLLSISCDEMPADTSNGFTGTLVSPLDELQEGSTLGYVAPFDDQQTTE